LLPFIPFLNNEDVIRVTFNYLGMDEMIILAKVSSYQRIAEVVRKMETHIFIM